MYAFASQDTPKRFCGSKPLKANAARGEAGDSLEGVMIGGEVSLAIPSHSTIQMTDPSDIIIVIRMSSGDGWKVLDGEHSRFCPQFDSIDSLNPFLQSILPV
jgi:hypothetical protein